MKYHLRTVSWRFKETTEDLPNLKQCRSVSLRSPEDVFRFFGDIFANQVRERFLAIWLDASNKVIGFEVVTEGTLNTSLVHPREVFRGAIVATAASIVVAHNHPSGSVEPSRADEMLTSQLRQALALVDIKVLDHFIVTDTSILSFAERGLI